MKKLITTAFSFMIFILNLYAQDSTKELLEAPKINKYIYLRPDGDIKELHFEFDKSDGNGFDDQMSGKVVVSSPKKKGQINIHVSFLNPLKYLVTHSDTTLSDPNYEGLKQFAELALGLSNLLNAQSHNVVPVNFGTKTVSPADAVNFGVEFDEAEPEKKLAMIGNIKSPDFNEWKFLYFSHDTKLLPNEDSFFQQLIDTDNELFDGDYTKKGSFLNIVQKGIDTVKNANEMLSLTNQNAIFKQYISALTNKNKLSENNIKKLETLSNSVLQKYTTLSDTDLDEEERKNKYFAIYTKDIVSTFLNNANVIQQKRDTLVKGLLQLYNQVDSYIKKSVGKKGTEFNSVLIARYNPAYDKIKDITVTIKKREVVFKGGNISFEEEKNDISGKIRLRAFQRFIPEFSTGIYYTDFSYPRYGTQEVDGKTQVAEAKTVKYPVVAAGMLNLIYNGFDGLMHPLIQAGIGTGKELPSLLGGIGFRFTEPIPFAISGGALWTWRNELNELKVGDIIDGTATLEKDLKYTLNTKPNFYLGLQFNF